MIPTLGRIVHICRDRHTDDKEGSIHAAIISAVSKRPALGDKEKYDSEENAYDVTLHVLTPWGMEMERHVRFNAEISGVSPVGLWFWPPKV